MYLLGTFFLAAFISALEMQVIGDQFFFCFEPLQVLARGLRDFAGFDYIIHEIIFRSQFLRGNFFLQLMFFI